MIRFLCEPFPLEIDLRKTFLGCLLVGIFIAGFLIIYQPFDISGWQHRYKALYLSGYGVITCIIPFFVTLVFRRRLMQLEANWTIWKQLVFMLFFISLIMVCSYCYTFVIMGKPLSLSAFPSFAAGFLLVAVLPLMANVYMAYRSYLEKHTRLAAGMNSRIESLGYRKDEPETVTFRAENEKDEVVLSTNALLYIQAADNYSEIYLLENGKVKKILIRSTLKRIEGQHELTYLVRCHRSTIVNLSQVKHISGNAQGYKISFLAAAEPVSVSRNFAPDILRRLESLKQS